MIDDRIALGLQIMTWCWYFLLNNISSIILLGLIVYFCIDFYTQFIKINRNTDSVDLTARYLYLEMKKKYGK